MTLQHSLMMFQESLRSPESVKMYTFLVKKFMKYHNIKDFDSIVKIEKAELQKMVETYVIYLKKNIIIKEIIILDIEKTNTANVII